MNAPLVNQPLLAHAFRVAGLQAGDDLIVHSSLRSLGRVEGGPETVIDTLLGVIGPGGNLMLPTFNYSRPIPEPYYDPDETPCRTGSIPETGRKRKDAVRSLHPTHSVAVIGPDAQTLTENHLKGRAFGMGSPIDRLAQRGGKVLLIGVGQVANSTIHIAEEYAGIPKATPQSTLPVVKVRLPSDSSQIIEHPLDPSPSCSAAFEAGAGVLRCHGAIHDARIGDCFLQVMKGNTLIDLIAGLLKEDPTALLCTNPACALCRGTRVVLDKC